MGLGVSFSQGSGAVLRKTRVPAKTLRRAAVHRVCGASQRNSTPSFLSVNSLNRGGDNGVSQVTFSVEEGSPEIPFLLTASTW